MPAVAPAVYSPVEVTVPPVARYVTSTGMLSPALVRPKVAKLWLLPVARRTVAGRSTSFTAAAVGSVGVSAVSGRTVTGTVSATLPFGVVATTW